MKLPKHNWQKIYQSFSKLVKYFFTTILYLLVFTSNFIYFEVLYFTLKFLGYQKHQTS